MIELLRYRDVTRVIYYRDLLERSDIRTFVRNENLSTSEGVSIPEFFPALCILNESDKEKAIDLIHRDRSSGGESNMPELICEACSESSPANFDTCWNCGSSLPGVTMEQADPIKPDLEKSHQTSRIKVISPMLAVADMDETLDFYGRVLGFREVMKSEEYSIVEKDGATIHFMKAADESVLAAVRGHAEIYIEVDDIGSIWERVEPFKGRYEITEPSDRDYGMTEFHINDPNGCLIFVGQETRKGD